MALLISTSVTAETKGKEYLGIQYCVALYTEENSSDYNPTLAGLRAGFNLNKNFALEARYGAGNKNDTGVISGVPVSVDIYDYRGVYAIASFSISKSIEPYIIVGFTSAKINYSNLGTVKEEGISYGAGFNLGGYGDTSWNIEYISYINDPDESISTQKFLHSVNIGANILF